MPKIDANHLKLHYWQSGKGPQVVLVHGLGGNLAGWHHGIVPELQQTFRVLTYDLRGHGRSEAPAEGYTTSEMVKDLRALLDVLGIEKAPFVGHSWGGDIVLHFAQMHPERVSALVIVEGALLAPLAPEYRRPEWSGWPYASSTIEGLLGRPIPDEHRYDLEYLLRQLIEIPMIYGPAQGRPRDKEIVLRVIDVLRPMWQGKEGEGNLSLGSLSAITQPTLLLYEANTAYPEAHRELSARLPASSSMTLPAGDLKHFSTLAHPGAIADCIRSFLAEQGIDRVDAPQVSK
ncbi:MAG: alpha/beta hydrolase [Vicinamibacterales bacterium]